jgi:hypothetical protein
VVLEGEALGLDRVTSVNFDPDANRLTLNGILQYPLPIPKEEMCELIGALRKDDRLGVSLADEKEIVYGCIDRKGSIARKLLALDKFFGAVIFGRNDELKGIELPENYTPRKAENRKQATAVCFQFKDFRFGTSESNMFLASCDLDVSLIPLLDRKAADGGHLPDEKAFQEGRMETSDLKNVAHIQSNLPAYLRMPVVEKGKRLGEAAALLRFLARQKMDLNALATQMKGN